MKRAGFFLAALVLALTPAARADDTRVGGPITSNTTWTLAASPYLVTSTVTVQSGITLMIEAGVTVKFNTGTYLDVLGKLTAVGTSGSGITFTSSAGTPAAGDWRAIYFEPSANSTSQISYATVRYAGYYGGNVVVDGSSPSMDHLTVTNSSAAGVYLKGSAVTASMSNSTLSSNATFGLNVTQGAGVTLTNTAFSNNTSYAVGAEANTRLLGMTGLTATGNGGGTKNGIGYGPGIISTNETWRPGLDWMPTSSLTIASNGILTINPGATVKLGSGMYIDIQGTLTAVGTSGSPITFTSSAVTPAPGNWTSLYFEAGTNPSQSQVSYATVSYGGAAYGGAVFVTGSSPQFDHVTVTNSSSYGVRVGTNGAPTFKSCAFTGNASGGLNNTTPTTLVTASLSYWGSSNGPSGRGPGSGQSVTTGVRYEPWLAAAPSSPNYVFPVTVTNRWFNPGLGQTASWSFQTASSGTWTLAVLNGSGQVVRTFTGTGASGTASWDGKNGSGVAQPDGKYTYKIDATNGTSAAATATGFVYRNQTPVVAIDTPASGALLSNFYQSWSTNVAVTGSASIDNMLSWTLDQGVGSNPSVWTTIATGTSAVLHGALGTWATDPLANNSYTLRLWATDSQAFTNTFSIPVTVGNFRVTQDVRQINAASGQLVTYRSTVPFTMTEQLYVQNEGNKTVKTLFNGTRTAGDYTDVWNGKNDSSQVLPDGLYRYVAQLTAGPDSRTWDLTAQTYGPNDAETYDGPQIAAFDPFNNSPALHTYTFLRPGRVYIALSNSSPVWEQPCPSNTCWSYWQEAGTHTFRWASVDRAGAYRTDVLFIGTVNNFPNTFPLNGVLVFGIKPVLGGVTVNPPVFRPLEGTPQTVTLPLSTYQSQSATVTVTFQNQQSLSVLRTITASGTPPTFSTQWDGRSDGGVLVAPGHYTVTATVTDAVGNQVSEQILTHVNY